MNNNDFPASRREFIALVSASCAALLSPELLAGDISNIHRKKGGPLRKGKILTLNQMKALAAISDVIIPRTDTASASDVDAHGVIDDQLAFCQSPKTAKTFITQLDRFILIAKKQNKRGFEKLNENIQIQTLKALANHQEPYNDIEQGWFLTLKSMVVLSYYTSEEGGSKELVYDPIPGGFNGHFKVSENQGRAFSIYHI